MADVIAGKASNDSLGAMEDKTQIYGLKGNDTLSNGGKSDVLLIGGSGDDVLNMTGGNGTLSGGKGARVARDRREDRCAHRRCFLGRRHGLRGAEYDWAASTAFGDRPERQ